MRTTPSTIPSAVLFFALAAAPHVALAQSVEAHLSGADTVRQGEQLRLSFSFEDVAPESFALPELVGLTVIGGPSRRSQMTIANGIRRSSTSLGYYVVAEQPGLAYVPPIVVPTAAGDTLSTKPLTVFVTDDPDYVPLDSAQPPARPRARRPPTVKM